MNPLVKHVVVWTIDIWAHTPQQAAEIALEIQRDKESEATVFDVTPEFGTTETVDLLQEVY